MVRDAIPSDSRLPELLAARAHAASSHRLRIDVLTGLLGAVVAVAWRPIGWIVLLGAALCFTTFGAWGLADRALEGRPALDHSIAVRALRVGRAAMAIVGTLAAATVGFGTLMLALGTWIS